MVNFWLIIPLTIVISIVAIGGGYLIWMYTRPKKMAWDARVYQLGDGIIPPPRDEEGNFISDIKLRDLRPYAKDVLERIEKEGLVPKIVRRGLRVTQFGRQFINSCVAEHHDLREIIK